MGSYEVGWAKLAKKDEAVNRLEHSHPFDLSNNPASVDKRPVEDDVRCLCPK